MRMTLCVRIVVVQIKVEWRTRKNDNLAILVTIIVGWIGAAIGLEIMNGFTELGSILAVATMGAFIMIENKRINKR